MNLTLDETKAVIEVLQADLEATEEILSEDLDGELTMEERAANQRHAALLNSAINKIAWNMPA